MKYIVELAQHVNGKFAGFQEMGAFDDKRAAWNFIKSHGYTAKDNGSYWEVTEVCDSDYADRMNGVQSAAAGYCP